MPDVMEFFPPYQKFPSRYSPEVVEQLQPIVQTSTVQGYLLIFLFSMDIDA